MAAKLIIGVPSKGRLKDNAASLFERANYIRTLQSWKV